MRTVEIDVGGTGTRVADNISGSSVDEVGLHIGRTELSHTLSNGSCASNVRRGHGGTRNGVNSSVGGVPSSTNAATRSKDVTAGTKAGEAGASVTVVNSHDGEGTSGTSRGYVAGIVVEVAGSNNVGNTSGGSRVDSIVNRLDSTPTYRKVDHISVGSAVGNYPVDSIDNTRPSPGTIVTHHLNSNQISGFSNTISRSAGSGGYMSAMTVEVGVRPTRIGLETKTGTTTKVSMGHTDPSVKDVNVHPSPRVGVVGVGPVLRQAFLVDTIDAPGGSAGLDITSKSEGVHFDVL
eukprot:Lithocolla_globosa_v1_NODE_205_length_5183_cov_23.943448.p3 type:complete len:292 gc:universal NODE_205_length_5183_cov_23.943448:1417-2292(+)